MMKKKFFYDPHLHLVNLSHAGLLAYLNRFLGKKKLSYKMLLNDSFISILYHFFTGKKSDDKAKELNEQKILLGDIRFVFFLSIILSVTFFFCLITFGCFEYFNLSVFWKKTMAILTIISLSSFTLIAILELLLLIKFLKRIFRLIKSNSPEKKEKFGIRKTIEAVINLISLLENDIGSSLLLIEMDILSLDNDFSKKILSTGKTIKATFRDFPKEIDAREKIKKEIEDKWKEYYAENNGFKIGNLPKENGKFEKYILTPLIVDFGYNRFEVGDVYYHNPPNKPVVSQTKDVFLGIQNYLNNSPFRIFEIYPFMGLNPEHYDLYIKLDNNNKPVKGHNSLELMFDKYFSLFNKNLLGQERYEKFENALPGYTDNLDKEVDEIIAKEVRKRLKIKIEQKKIDSNNININEITKILNEIKDKPELGFNKSADEIRNKFYNYFFIGIKVYPPLGFDPAPWMKKELKNSHNQILNKLYLELIKLKSSKTSTDELEIKDREYFKKKTIAIVKHLSDNLNFNNNDEVEKQIYVYLYCEEKNIPIVTHCNDGGFLSETEENTTIYTNPERWEWVLKLFPDLKINFAHLGGGSFKKGKSKKAQDKEDKAKIWREKVYYLIKEFDNVYTDFSCMCFDKKDYKLFKKELNNFIKENGVEKKDIYKKILFGTDFSVNMMFGAKSYQDYIKNFSIQTYFNKKQIEMFSEINPEKFLFG